MHLRLRAGSPALRTVWKRGERSTRHTAVDARGISNGPASEPLGALHHVAHGVANALALPAVTAFNEPCLGEKGPVLAEALGSGAGEGGAAGSRDAASGIASLRERLSLDRGLDGIVRTGAEREAVAAAALKSGNIATNPREPTLADVRAVVSAMREPLRGTPPAERLLRPAGG